MALNIKNDDTEQLSRELARLTGESLTAAVTVAVRERLERLRADQVVPVVAAGRLLSIGRRTAPAMRAPADDDLYGPDGLYR